MVKIFRTIDNNVHQINEAQEGSWIALIDPTATEIVEIAEKYDVKKLEEKQFINKYKDYRYTFELIEK